MSVPEEVLNPIKNFWKKKIILIIIVILLLINIVFYFVKSSKSNDSIFNHDKIVEIKKEIQLDLNHDLKH